MKIGNIELKNKIIAAPLAGISNAAYRKILYEMGAGLVYSEMVSDKALFYNSAKTFKMIEVDKCEHPLSMQIFGGDLDSLVYAAKLVDTKCDCDIIDINMGCPVNKVVKTGAGSKMLCDVDKTYKMVKAVVDSVKKPVTVKMRLGWDKESINAIEVAKMLEKAGVSAIAVHARTRSQFYEGNADWSYIKKIKEAVSIPVIGNGDVKSPIDAKRMLEETGCDAVMIGRAYLGNPWIIKQCVDYLELGTYQEEIDINERIEMCLRHARDLISLYNDENVAIKEMRSHACWYIKGQRNATKFKNSIHSINTYDELKSLLNDFVIQLNNEQE